MGVLWRATMLVLSTAAVSSLADNNADANRCIELNPQTSLDIDQLMGIWHGIEIIQHQELNTRTPTEEICPVIFISETMVPETSTEHNYRGGDHSGYDYNSKSNYNRGQGSRINHRYNWRNMSLLWDQGSFTVRYSLRFERPRPGFWISYGPYNGSSLMENKFNYFSGNVQVLKAVGTHLVLTFCHILPNNELFTIVLARQPTLDDQDIISVHKLLSRRQLPVGEIRKVCRNGASPLRNDSLLFVMFAALFAIHLLNIHTPNQLPIL